MWVQSTVDVGNERVRLSIERLDDEARERTAATLAWLTLEAFTIDDPEEHTSWHEFASEVLRRHVTFAVPDTRVRQITVPWWNEALARALTCFIRENNLATSINRHIETLLRVSQPGRRES